MDLQIQTQFSLRKPTLRSRMMRRIRRTYQYDTRFWRISIAGPWGAGMFAFALAALGLPTGLGLGLDLLLFLFTATVGMFFVAHTIAVLLALIGLPVPRLFIGTVLFDLGAAYFIFDNDESFKISIIVAAILTLIGVIAGLITGLLFKLYNGSRTGSHLRTGMKIIGALSICIVIGLVVSGSTKSIQSVADSDQSMDNPAEPGTYAVTTFNYGSGKDIWQPEFGAKTDLISQSVDASAYITNWSKYRTMYLRYDEKALPLNGRVWMPEGSSDESYPLILIVHGNHLMEDYSDAGYAYLGELLASRGFIAVSVDENFLNYSAWTGIPNNDMKVRAWVLLKHLQQIHTFAQSPGTPFFGKVDMSRIGLIGHSRGGQAIAMAADDASWFKSDATLDSVKEFNIRALAAIAPTDKKVDGINAKLKDINYLTIQGANDGDVSDFDGDRQYNRSSFTKGTDFFKASLYVQGANHSQFNTDWGLRDISFPSGILLNRDQFLSGVNQRMIAKLYISAFMETSLHEETRYMPLFRDFREALPLMPETTYINQYEDGHFTMWTRFEEDSNRQSLPKNGTAEGENILWREVETKNRGKSNKGDHALILERTQPGQEESVYRMSWPYQAPQPTEGPPELLSFALADQRRELDEIEEQDNPKTDHFSIEIEVMDGNGMKSRLPLSQFRELPALSEVQFTLHPWLELHMSDGKYNNPTEAIFQTYQLPIAEFVDANPEFAPDQGIKSLSFILIGDRGKIMLDDIGVY